MATIDFDKRSFFRPIFEDRIQYLFIAQKPKSINYEPPEMFNSKWLDSIKFMPKSILQIIDPLEWHLTNTKNQISSHINFSIIFDDYPIEDYNFLFNIPNKVLIIFLNSQNEEIFQRIEVLDRFFLVGSDDNNIYYQIKSSTSLQSKAFHSCDTLLKKILDFTLHELNITSEEFANLQKRRFEQAEQILRELNFKEVPIFIPARVNTANIYQILSLDKPNLLTTKAVEPQERIKVILETSSALGMLSQLIKFSKKDKLPDSLGLPTIIFSYPFLNPDYRELFKKTIDNIHNDNERDKVKKMRYLRFIEQDINTYNYIDPESKNSKIESELLRYALSAKQHHTCFLDFVGYLHSTFEVSPYIRVPARGASLNEYISRLSPSQYKKAQNSRSLIKNITQIGKALATNLPTEIINFLARYADGIFAISDLPIEWLSVQDIPLAFLCDLCRVPETPVTSILSQFNLNKSQTFRIQKNILRNSLVVCGATAQDPIFKRYQYNLNLKNEHNHLLYKTAHIQSKDDFFEIVNKIHPHLLIIDSHGNFEKQSEGSYIWIGNEKLTGNDIVEHLPQIPLVILSCCWGTPIYGNSNTIAQAFFERGSFSVVSTFLPISVDQGFTLYVRILNNLENAARAGIHESWMNFISHNLRTSYIDDLLIPIFDKFGVDVLEETEYVKHRLEWQLNSMYREARHPIYKEAKEIVLRCIKDKHKSKVERFLKNNEPIPEFMLYTHLGRGDLIKFDSWIKKNNA